MSNEIEKKKTAALNISDMVQAMKDDDQGVETDVALPVVSIKRDPQVFEYESGEVKKILTGRIVYMHKARQYWADPYTGQSQPPTCGSFNGVTPLENVEAPQSDRCDKCPMNDWGSDPKGGLGKACQESYRIFFLEDGRSIPCRIKLPPSSIGPKDSFKAWVRDYRDIIRREPWMADKDAETKMEVAKSYYLMRLELGLTRKTFAKSGMSASCLSVAVLSVSNPEDGEEDLPLAYEWYRRLRDDRQQHASHVMAETAGQDASPPQGTSPSDDKIPF